ncbi:hypothetical protein [Rudanella lutea]|uniref:hypothetical protein n=1 Tax=Rudanella lutea TaxID=451374 RepID=UPI00035C964B|nr:hypothetical protein [Rudanella lutea]
MNSKKMYLWLLGLTVWFGQLGGVAWATTPRDAYILTTPWLADSDLDGVDDAVDLCPGTPTGTPVNAYGCPVSLSTCDYNTSTVSLMSTGGSSGTSVTTAYVLTDAAGTILQVRPTATFSGLSGTATYMAVALTYEGTATNLTVGGSLSAVTASCFDLSNALVFKACVPPSTTCDYEIGNPITLQITGGSSGTGVKTSYVLTDATDKILQVSATPTFSTTGLVAGTYKAYAVTYNDDGTITNLVPNGTNSILQVTSSCLALSPGLPLVLCGGCIPRCVPITVTRL